MLNRSSSIGFLITDKSDITFLGPFIEKLGSEYCVIIYDDREKGISLYGNQLQIIKKYLYPNVKLQNFIPISEVLKKGDKLDLLISIHPYIIHDFVLIAKMNFRLSYSISKFSWQFGPINSYYDMVLTQGPYSTHIIKKNFGLPCLEVGYPRYLNHQSVRDEDFFKLLGDTERPIVSFFPAIGSRSIQQIEEVLIESSHIAKFLIKVHPIEAEELKEYYKNLGKKFTVIFENEDHLIQNETIIKNSDLIVHDIGGTCFSSLYFEKNFAFLKRDISKGKIWDTTPEDILYKLISRTIDKNNFMNDLKILLSNPLVYEKRLAKIRDIFISKNSSEKFSQSIKFILEYDRYIMSKYTFSRFSIKIRKLISNFYSIKLRFKLKSLLKKSEFK